MPISRLIGCLRYCPLSPDQARQQRTQDPKTGAPEFVLTHSEISDLPGLCPVRRMLAPELNGIRMEKGVDPQFEHRIDLSRLLPPFTRMIDLR